MLRPLLVFLHISGAMGVVAGLAVELATLLQLRRTADPARAGATLAGFRITPRLGIPSLLLTIASGAWLAAAVWGWRAAWIQIGFSGLILVAVVGGVMNGPAVTRMLKTEIADVRSLRRVWTSFGLRLSLLIGILFLMTVKPPMAASLIAMAVAIGAGIIAALFLRKGVPA
jgi:hypothetical protein